MHTYYVQKSCRAYTLTVKTVDIKPQMPSVPNARRDDDLCDAAKSGRATPLACYFVVM